MTSSYFLFDDDDDGDGNDGDEKFLARHCGISENPVVWLPWVHHQLSFEKYSGDFDYVLFMT